MKLNFMVLLLSILIFGIGCASYNAKSVAVHKSGSYPHKSTVSEVTIVADVYGTEKKYKSVFDTCPSYERGYIGINLIFFNNSKYRYMLDVDNITCVTNTGDILSVIPASQVAEQLLRSTTGRYFMGGFIAAGSSKGANDKIRADYRNKELHNQNIPAGTRKQGFVFFTNEEQIDYIIIRGLTNNETGEELTFKINLPKIPIHD